VPRSIACAVIREDPPEVFVADDQETLNWVLALHVVARTPARELPPALRDRLRDALRNERWGEAVQLWIEHRTEVDVYPSFDCFTSSDVDMGADELQFTPLFED